MDGGAKTPAGGTTEIVNTSGTAENVSVSVAENVSVGAPAETVTKDGGSASEKTTEKIVAPVTDKEVDGSSTFADAKNNLDTANFSAALYNSVIPSQQINPVQHLGRVSQTEANT